VYHNKFIHVKSNNDYWKCRHPGCNRLIKVIDNLVFNEPKHPTHKEVPEVEIECLLAIQKMKDEAKNDKTSEYRVVYDRNIKLLTDKKFKLVDISDFIFSVANKSNRLPISVFYIAIFLI
jgi:hypothetical protein